MLYSDIEGNMNKARVGEPVRGSFLFLESVDLRLICENSQINLEALIEEPLSFDHLSRGNLKELNNKQSRQGSNPVF